MLILTLFALLEIIRRYIFGLAFEWGQDAVIVGMVSAVAIYFGVTQVRRGHLVMGAIIQSAAFAWPLHGGGHRQDPGVGGHRRVLRRHRRDRLVDAELRLGPGT